MSEWDRSYHGIGIKYEPKIVRVKNDQALRRFLRGDDRKGHQLAKDIKQKYLEQFGQELKISTNSLATEIRSHYNIQWIFSIFEHKSDFVISKATLRKFVDSMQLHMDVIDCGEKDVDNNRWVWDILCKTKKKIN